MPSDDPYANHICDRRSNTVCPKCAGRFYQVLPSATTDALTDDPLPGAKRWLEQGVIREWTAASMDAEFHIRRLVAEIERLRAGSPAAGPTGGTNG
jgi:hypothetical protein